MRSYAAHANGYVTKPVNLDELERTVGQIAQFFGEVAFLPG